MSFVNPALVQSGMIASKPVYRGGLTAVELLIVIAVMATLFGLTLPAISRLRESGHNVTCQNNLRQLGAAVHQYHQQHGKMPPYMSTLEGRGAASWFYFLLPFVDQNQPKRSEIHGSFVGTSTAYPVLTCPSDPSPSQEPHLSKTNYLANWYAFTDVPQGCFAPPQSFSSLHNGLSNVVLFAEGYSVCNKIPRPSLEASWYHNFGVTSEDFPSDHAKYLPKDYTMFQVRPSIDPAANGCDNWRTQTPHNVMHVGLADGSVRSVQAMIDPVIWKKALKPRTNDPPPRGW